ncbi:MAG: DUF2070 family protein [Candidatus Caldarchaeum sp.]
MVSTAAGKIAQRYRLVKGFYGGHASIWALFFMAAVFAGFSFVFTGNVLHAAGAFAGFLFLTLLLNRVAEKLLTKKCPNYTARRLDSLSVVEMMIVLSGVMLSALLAFFNPYAGVVLATGVTSVAVYIGYSVRRAIGLGLGIPVAAILSTPAALIHIFTVQTYINNMVKALQLSLSAYALGVAAMETLRVIIDKTKPVQNLKPFKLFQAFLSSLLSGHSHELEKMMTQLGGDEKVSFELFLVKREGKPDVAVVVSDIHPGPFRAVGSSMFPSLIQQKLGNRGIHGMVLKGLSSHEKNLASIAISEEIAEKIAEEAERLRSSPHFSSVCKPPSRKRFNGVSTYSLEIAGREIAIVTLHPQPMEDLPPEILPDGKHEKLVVVDAHNSFDDNLKHLDEQTIEKIRTHLENMEKHDGKETSVSIGFSRMVPADIGLTEGMGAGGVSCMVFEYDGMRSSLIVADANNALPWVRTVAIEAAKQFGCVDAEFCTTDTHMVNAVVLGGRGYHPFGEAIPVEKIKKIFTELHRKAVEDLAPAQAIHKKIVIEKARVFSDFLDKVSQAINFGVKSYGVASAAGFIASTALTVVLM